MVEGKNQVKTQLFGMVRLLVVSSQVAFTSAAAWAAPPQPVTTVQDVLVRNTPGTPVPVSVPVMSNPYIRSVTCSFQNYGKCDKELPLEESGYIWGIEFSLVIRGNGPCSVYAMVRDSPIATYQYEKTMDENTGELTGTPDTFNRVVLPRLIPFVEFDVFKVLAVNYRTAGTNSSCQATVNFLTNAWN
jgi:hypothetical protein